MEYLFMVIGIGFLIYFFTRAEPNYTFNYDSEGAAFNGQVIAYDKLLKIERDMGFNQGRTMNFAYIITYYNEQSQVTTTRVYIALTDSGKWNGFKDQLAAVNPAVIVSESIL